MIRLAVRVASEQADVVLAELLDLAPGGVEESDLGDGRVEYAVYGPPGELPALPDLQALANGAAVEISTREIADDWQERWKDFHRPVLIGAPPSAGTGFEVPSIRVRPPWEPAAEHGPRESKGGEVIELVVDPGQAFGTGAHASTRLCLSLLLELVAADEPATGQRRAVLDIGTGSGVLAIAAARLGFAPVLALDNEHESVSAAEENARQNGVQLHSRHYDLRSEPLPWLGAGSSEQDAPSPGRTVVLANLLRPLLLELVDAIDGQAPSNLIASGLLVAELDEIAAAFSERHGMSERRRLLGGEWGALWLQAAD